MATNIIAEPLAARPPKPSSRGAINILARQAARKAVREQLLSEGKRLSRVKAADIAAMAQQYLEAHPEARERAIKMGMIDGDIPKDDAVVEEPTSRDKPLPPETPKPEGWGEKPKRSLIEKLKRLLQRVFGM